MNQSLTIVAHRGSSETAPENTIPSFNLAFKENADFIEGDFWLTKDEQIVCIHDSNTKRVTERKNKIKVRSATLAELKELDVGSWKGEEFKRTRIPTLEEVLQIIPAGKGIYLEIKDDREIFLKKLSDILNKSDFQKDNIRIISFYPKMINLTKKYLPEVKTYWLFGWYSPKRKCLNSLAERRMMQTLKTLHCDGINVNSTTHIDENLVKSLGQNNLDFCVYNVEDPSEAVRLVKLGINSITTNSPLKIRSAVESVFQTNIQ